jgi:hypothetical protein
MAEQKTEGQATQPTTSESAKAAGKKITKKEAVRRSLKKLGNDAPTRDIQADIKKRFHLDMTTDHISTTKSQLRKEASKAESAKPAAAQPARPAPANGKSMTVDMQDVLTLKTLVQRIGPAHLKTLIDVMSR